MTDKTHVVHPVHVHPLISFESFYSNPSFASQNILTNAKAIYTRQDLLAFRS